MAWKDAMNLALGPDIPMEDKVPKATNRFAASQRGFTLIELMIVVVIIGIIASIAGPQYNEYMRKTQLREVVPLLSDYQVKMEQYFQDNKNYGAANGTDCATDGGASKWNNFDSDHKLSSYFSFACVLPGNATNGTYTITATGRAGLVKDDYVYTIDQAGNKKTTKFKGAAVDLSCWSTSGSC